MICVLDRLDVSIRALKRAQYEAFDFRLTDGGVTVRNGSHANPDDHVYDVTVRDGVPVACTCPADEHQETTCKHRLAVAIRKPVLDAATIHTAREDIRENRERNDDSSGAVPLLVTDGAGLAHSPSEGGDPVDPERPDDCACLADPDSFPCWPCVRDGYRELPEDDRIESADD